MTFLEVNCGTKCCNSPPNLQVPTWIMEVGQGDGKSDVVKLLSLNTIPRMLELL